MVRRLGSLALALGIVGASGFGALVGGTWGFGLKCDDSCGTPPPWREDPNAWQWDALGWVGIAGLAAALVFFAVLLLRSRPAAWLALGAWVLFAVAFVALLEGAGLLSGPAGGFLMLAAAALAGAGAVALIDRRGTPPAQTP